MSQVSYAASRYRLVKNVVTFKSLMKIERGCNECGILYMLLA